jgi:exonuclease VII small subunit
LKVLDYVERFKDATDLFSALDEHLRTSEKRLRDLFDDLDASKNGEYP